MRRGLSRILLLIAVGCCLPLFAEVPTLTLAPDTDNSQLGWGFAVAGDIDGDGTPDLAVTDPSSRPGGLLSSGIVYIISGADGSILRSYEGSQPAVRQVGRRSGCGWRWHHRPGGRNSRPRCGRGLRHGLLGSRCFPASPAGGTATLVGRGRTPGGSNAHFPEMDFSVRPIVPAPIRSPALPVGWPPSSGFAWTITARPRIEFFPLSLRFLTVTV